MGLEDARLEGGGLTEGLGGGEGLSKLTWRFPCVN